MSDKTKIIDRVKKLLAMSADVGSPEEAVIAARRARSLMDKHQIEAYEVEQFSARSRFNEVHSGKPYKYTPLWLQFLGAHVARWNDCQSRRIGNASGKCIITFLGFEYDVITAKAIYEYLRDTILRLCRDQKYGNHPSRQKAFKLGAVSIIGERIDEIMIARATRFTNSTGTDLVVVKKDLVDQQYGEQQFKTVSYDVDPDGYLDGQNAAQDINLHDQVEGGQIFQGLN